MKIGIFTYHFTNNIGSVLQAYALQKKLLNLGYDSDIINYQKKGWKDLEYSSYKRAIRKLFGKLECIIWPICLILIKNRENKFYNFRKKYLKINSDKFTESKETLCDLEKQYDKFIVGSDQIWNYNNIKFDPTYLLDFVKDSKKKNAYAPSFGIEKLDNENKEIYRKHLSDFKYLSAREQQGGKLIYDLLGKECPVLLDPTLLLNKYDWEQIAVKPKYKDEYILIYLMAHSDSAIKFAEKLADIYKIRIVQIVSYRKRNYNNSYVYNVTPNEWLGLFANAKFIITNSFHGTAFSMNFNKNFFVEPLKAGAVNTNSRLMSIIDIFSLQNRLIINGDNSFIHEQIDYKKIMKQLEVKRDEASQYLEHLVNDYE